ncbi:hypothetical protein NPIL_115421, partial [Nephila pilipes]
LNRIAISSDIRQAFLQICLADKHKDDFCGQKVIQATTKCLHYKYTFSTGFFLASPFLLAATVKYQIEKYRKSHPITVLGSFMYLDDWITGQETREEALLLSLHVENIMKEWR